MFTYNNKSSEKYFEEDTFIESDFFLQPVESPPVAIRKNAGLRHFLIGFTFKAKATSLCHLQYVQQMCREGWTLLKFSAGLFRHKSHQLATARRCLVDLQAGCPPF